MRLNALNMNLFQQLLVPKLDPGDGSLSLGSLLPCIYLRVTDGIHSGCVQSAGAGARQPAQERLSTSFHTFGQPWAAS